MDSEEGTNIFNGALSGAGAGAALGPEGALVGGVIGAGLGLLKPKRPKYNIAPEVNENKALASESAFGVNPEIERGIQSQDQNMASTVSQGQQYTNNTGSILNLLRSANTARNQGVNSLLAESGNLQSQGRSQLMGANQQGEAARDKAFEYNQAQPFKYQTESIDNMVKGTSQNLWKMLDAQKAAGIMKEANSSIDI